MKKMSAGLAFGVVVAAAVATPLSAAQAVPSGSTPAPTAAQAIGAEQAKVADAGRTLGLGADQKLVVRDVVVDTDGTRHVRYERTYRGLRVLGGDLVVEQAPGGAAKSVHWNASGRAAMPATTATLSGARAESLGRKASGFSVDSSHHELVVQLTGTGSRLAYDVVTEGVRADQTPSRLHTVVDAKSGATLRSWDEVKTGTGRSQYSGTVAIPTLKSGSTFQLKDSIGNSAEDLNGKTDLLPVFPRSGTIFTDADDVWGNGATSDRATAGVDAMYGAQKTFEFYKNMLGRNGIKNDGKGARSRVHYGSGYVNAFWNGSMMTYGDGAGNAKPLTQLDVAAHEMSHGVTENTANLDYSGDAGGLNEATSDIMATSAEFWLANAADPGDYLIGEKIDIRGNGAPLRYMDRPSRDGSSQDCWTTGTKDLDPHYSSGPLNHWFYLVSEGSGAKTVNGVAYDSPVCGSAAPVTGAGRDAATKVWYRTLSTKLTSTSTYADARNGAISSAKELYGAGSPQCVAVKSAFDAIAVPAGSQTC
ncbi:peptidase [Phycicoccus sp. Root101]|nr:peptidase [Phycicoccus sp. Root101]